MAETLKRQKEEVDREAAGERSEKTERKYNLLEDLLKKLINEVGNSPKFPGEVEETIYRFKGPDDHSELALVRNFKQTYALTKDGKIRKIWEYKRLGDPLRLAVKTLDAENFVDETIQTDPKAFDIICDNLKRITKRYGIDVDEEGYLIACKVPNHD